MEIIFRRLEYWHRCGGSLWVGDLIIKNQEFTLRLKRADCDFSHLLLSSVNNWRDKVKTSLRQPTVHLLPWILRLTVLSPPGLVEDAPTAVTYILPMLALFFRLLLTWKWYIAGALQSAWQAMCFARTTLYFTVRAKETGSADVTYGSRGPLSGQPPALEQEWLFWIHWNKWVQVGNILENLFLLIWKAEIFFPKKCNEGLLFPKKPPRRPPSLKTPPCALPVRCSRLKPVCFQGSWTSDHECPNSSTILPGKTNH